MAASLAAAVVDGSPGNVLTLAGSGLVPGSPQSVTLANQGVTAVPGLASAPLRIPGTLFNGTNVTVPLPDGITSGTLTVMAGDLSVATCALRVRSQYVQVAEYNAAGEGWDTSTFAPGELDAILKRASERVDSFMGHSLRLLQVLERHKYRAPRNEQPPRLFPWRTRGRRCPLVSVDQLTFVSAQNLVTTFNSNDVYINDQIGYLEILAYAVGNYALLGALQVIGYSANVFELTFTSGYSFVAYPGPVMDATSMIASAMLDQRNMRQLGLGGLTSFGAGKDLPVSAGTFGIPEDAKRILGPYVAQMVG